MKKISAVAALILGVIASGQSVAGVSSVDLRVSGKLVPSVCTISGGGAGINLGDIDIGKLNKDKPTVLKDNAKDVTITVGCPSATLTAIKFTDVLDSKDSNAFSLGKKGDKDLGSFQLVLDGKNSQVDGKPVTSSANRDEKGFFHMIPNFSDYPMVNGRVITTTAFDMSSSSQREAAESKIFKLSLIPTINATDDIGQVNEAELHGAVTVDIIYV